MAAILIKSFGQFLARANTCPSSACCDCATRIICSPFTPYLVVTFGLNILPIVWTYKSIAAVIEHHNGTTCIDGTRSIYLWLNGILAVSHLIGSIYIVYRIQRNHRNVVEEDRDIDNLQSTIQNIYSRGLMSFDDVSMTHHVNYFPNNNKNRSIGFDETDGIYRQFDLEDTTKNTNGKGYIVAGGNKRSNIKQQQEQKGDQLPKPTPMKSVASTIASLNPQRNDIPEGQKIDDGAPSSFRRLGQVLCYDSVVAAYIVVATIWMMWQLFGLYVSISSAGRMNTSSSSSYSANGDNTTTNSNSYYSSNYYEENNGDDGDDDNNDAGTDDVYYNTYYGSTGGATTTTTTTANHFLEDCGCHFGEWVVASTVLGFAYMTVVFFTFGCSLLCLR